MIDGSSSENATTEDQITKRTLGRDQEPGVRGDPVGDFAAVSACKCSEQGLRMWGDGPGARVMAASP